MEKKAGKKTAAPKHRKNESILMKELAEQMKLQGIETGQNRLFQWMRHNGFLTRLDGGGHRPTDKSLEMGFFELDARKYQRFNGRDAYGNTIRVTPKGQEFFMNVFTWNREKINAREAAKRAERSRKKA